MTWTRQNPCLLLSIEHTATRFWNERLQECGPRGVYHRHINPDAVDDWAPLVVKFSPIFCTVRHPLATAISWARQGKDISELPRRWNVLTDFVAGQSPSYLSVDSEAREVLLADVAIRHGVVLGHNDWQPVGQNPGAQFVTLSDEGIALVDETLSKHRKFWGRFYAL